MNSYHKTIIIAYLFFFIFPLKSQISLNRLDSLFNEVQMQSVFSDQKKFVDCTPKYHPDVIIDKYNKQKARKDFDLKEFVGDNFDTNLIDTSQIIHHINYLWKYLTRNADTENQNSTLIPLPNPYIVPGGRFREIYYWDSYFTMLGLQVSGEYELIENMVDNFAYLIDNYGYIPNGNRTYYLSRSQPPFFSLMIELLTEIKGDSVLIKYLPQLEKEYEFWMNGKEELDQSFSSNRRVILLEKNEYLNRYWDELGTPRPESFKYDVEVFMESDSNKEIYRHIRAAAESGWDFSSRWFEDNKSLASIQTTLLIPVDLNCLMYHLEKTISMAYFIKEDENESKYYSDLADKRKNLILKYFWDNEKGYFFDFNIKNRKLNYNYTLAGVYPLFFLITDSNTAMQALEIIKSNFLMEGGLVTTLNATGQQWDYPNGWAPLQWIGYKSCKNYRYNSLANSIAQRWMDLNIKVFFETGKMLEKYDVVNINRPGGGGEYKLQDGFGWTNGVFLKLWEKGKKD
ncbi:alpha,alpha-trehalase TreF [Bacteroidota bacterium]